MKKLAFIPVALLFASCGNNDAENTELPAPVQTEEMQKPVSDVVPEEKKTNHVKKEAKEAKADSHTAKPDRTVEDDLMDLVLDLPEIRKQDEETRKATNGARGLKSYIKGRPSDDNEYYTVGVGEDNGSSLVTRYTFHVYPDNSILVYDPVKDEEITLKKWRKSL